jgi:hypothetical protein
MNITANITSGMTPQEKEVFLSHQEMRHKEEAEKIALEKDTLKSYKQKLIEDALKYRPDLAPERVKRMSIRTLERIF